MDWLILTAANKAQALGYRAQLRGRTLPVRNWRVIPDPNRRRAGSGGSTLWVLSQLASELRAGKRVLIIHSGGDSRRLCAYAAQGKIFLPLPCSRGTSEPSTLFDLVLDSLLQLPATAKGQVLVASGDVLLTFDPSSVDFSRPGVTGVAYPGPMERGLRHGIYVARNDGRVANFLQKPDEATARRHGAVDAVGRVLIDTGLVSLQADAVQRLLKLAGGGFMDAIAGGAIGEIDLYRQILMALVPGMSLEEYLAAQPDGPRPALKRIHRTLHGLPFHVDILPYCEFFHVGSSRELLANISTLNRTAKASGFSNFDRSAVADRSSLEGAFVYNTVLRSSQVRAGKGVLIESTHASGPMELEGKNLVVGVPPEVDVPIRLPEGWGMVCLPIGDRAWTAVVFGIDDDFKTPLAKGGTFGNRPDRETGRAGGPKAETLWDAPMWAVGEANSVVASALSWCRGKPPEGPLHSLRELIGIVHHGRIRELRADIQRVAALENLGARLERDSFLPAERVLALLRREEDAPTAMRQIDRALTETAKPLARPHLYRLAWAVSRKSGALLPSRPSLRGDAMERAAFEAVAEAVARQIALPAEPRAARILPDQVVWVTCPVRIDLAGGWSDTPPVCNEVGGTVLNAAITLNGQYPVQVVAKLAERRSITLTSLDLGERVEITRTPEPAEYQDPSQWAALPKAALILSGMCPADPRRNLDEWLKAVGGGLDITLFAAVPKGSGLGTSSILGAAVIACLARALGEPLSRETLIARTSLLEQMMTTGGGWQDQVGGIVPGVKLIRTSAGLDQTPNLRWTVFDMSPRGDLRQRLLLYYTGYRRLAKNILHNVVGRYLERDPATLEIVRRLKELAECMHVDLESGDVESFGRGVDKYWELKKAIDPGATNDRIEKLLGQVRRHLSGKLLPGAGGGGFVFMLARDADAARHVRRILGKNPPNRLARFFDFDVDDKGLSVTVL